MIKEITAHFLPTFMPEEPIISLITKSVVEKSQGSEKKSSSISTEIKSRRMFVSLITSFSCIIPAQDLPEPDQHSDATKKLL